MEATTAASPAADVAAAAVLPSVLAPVADVPASGSGRLARDDRRSDDTAEHTAALADRVEQLASELRNGTLTPAGLTDGMRDSELLVSVLGALLKQGR
jgi:hypothetical protein